MRRNRKVIIFPGNSMTQKMEKKDQYILVHLTNIRKRRRRKRKKKKKRKKRKKKKKKKKNNK